MTRPIDADAVYKWYLEAFKGRIKPNEIRFSINDIRDNLQNIPTIDAVPVKHGKWIWTEDKDDQYGYVYKCSVCGTSTIGDSERFCGWCGADMRGEK